MKIPDNARWAAAILVAALFGGGARIRNAFLALLGILKDNGRKVPAELYQKRLLTCQNCPLWYSPLRTCGSPLRKSLRGYGCYCQMEVKAKYVGSECWLDAELGDSAAPNGWNANGCGQWEAEGQAEETAAPGGSGD